VDKLTRLDAALPFIVGALLIVVGGFVSALVVSKVKDLYRARAREANTPEEDLPDEFKPEYIAKTSQWIIDIAQVLTALLAPLVGLILLRRHGNSDELAILYLGVFAFAFGIFVGFFRADVSRYGTNFPEWLTPIVAMTLALNVLGAVLAYVIGP